MIKCIIEHKTKKTLNRVFPYIGKKDELFVLFTQPNIGFVVGIDECFELDEFTDTPEIGYYSTNWVEDKFKPFEDKLILQNIMS